MARRINRDYTFSIIIPQAADPEYIEGVKKALEAIRLVAIGSIGEQTYDRVDPKVSLSEEQRNIITEFDKLVRDKMHYIERKDLEEIGVTPGIGVEFETDRIDFVWGKYKITGYQEPYWVVDEVE